MLPLRESTRRFIFVLKPLATTSILLLASLIAVMYLKSPVLGAASTQMIGQNNNVSQGMIGNRGSVTSPMSMAEMGAMMDNMMSQMNSMMASAPMTGSMPMSGMMSMTEMGQAMQMMGMMHQRMAQMQMMMGAMMSGKMSDAGMMNGSMMGEGTGTQNATPETTAAAPEVTASVGATATAAVSENAESSEPEAGENESAHPAPALATTPQRATAGTVTVEAVPLASEELLDIAFAITLETHSVELDFDLAELATLTIGKASFPATGWTPDAPSGHHVAGTLRFIIDHPAHAALAEVGAVTLELQDIDGQLVTLTFAIE
jgi:hypothetical protein